MWIDVKDKLPENGQIVLVIYQHPKYKHNEIILSRFQLPIFEAVDKCCCKRFSGNVTYWMQLPKVPNE
jgi:hypothetical protein